MNSGSAVLGTHHPDAIVQLQAVLDMIKVKCLVSEGDGAQEVRYGFQDGR